MIRISMAFLLLNLFLLHVSTHADDIAKRDIQPLLNKYCTDCHNAKKQKGKVRLDDFSTLSKNALEDMMNKVEEQVYLRQMPPEDEEQLSKTDYDKLLNSITAHYTNLGKKSSLREKLQMGKFGNYIDHDMLFSGEIKDKAFSPARRWLVSPYIYENRISRIAEQGRNVKLHKILGGKLANPFQLPDVSGVQYYDNGVANGGHFLTLMSNVKIISYAQLCILPPKDASANEEKSRALELAIKNVEERYKKNPKLNTGHTKLNLVLKRLKKQYPLTPALTISESGGKKVKAPEAFDVILSKKSAPTLEEIKNAINYQFSVVHLRKPTEKEMTDCIALTSNAIAKVGNTEGLRAMLVAVLMQSDSFYRYEFGQGKVDQYGRKLLSPSEASFAIAYALTEKDPDEELRMAAEKGLLKTKEDYKKQIERILMTKAEPTGIDPRLRSRHTSSFYTTQMVKLRFFREFFGYSKAYQVFKDKKRFGSKYDAAIKLLINDADLMVEKILEKDQDVFKELLTTDKFYLYHSGDNEATTKAVNKHKDVVQTIIKDFHSMEPKKFLAKHKRSFSTYLNLSGKSFNKKSMEFLKEKIDTIQSNPSYTPVAFGNIRHGGRGMGRSVNRTTMFNIDPYTWSYEPVQPFKIPNRMGILTHPVWLVAQSLNTSTDPVKRGKWIREKLLAGFIPDVPITVDAAIPENHNQTLRQRLHDKTKDKACWKCHESMNPLGYAFEMYDDFGRYRTAEELEYPEHIVFKAPDKGQYIRNKYKTLPLDTRGYLDGTGDHKLDGEVENAIDLITRLAKSDRVRQSIIRHVFRYFMGRNEMLSDSQTLINADKAYVKSGGSFNALIVSLLTSDSFMYRKETKE